MRLEPGSRRRENEIRTLVLVGTGLGFCGSTIKRYGLGKERLDLSSGPRDPVSDGTGRYRGGAWTLGRLGLYVPPPTVVSGVITTRGTDESGELCVRTRVTTVPTGSTTHYQG